MTLAYLYKWTHTPSNKWYIGSRTKKKCHPNDGYICSRNKGKTGIKQSLESNKKRSDALKGIPRSIEIKEKIKNTKAANNAAKLNTLVEIQTYIKTEIPSKTGNLH